MTLELSVSDAPYCGVTYDCHSDNSRGVIYALRVFSYAPREHLYIVQASLLMIVIYDHHIFIAQAIGANVTKLFTSVINKCLQ